jgi:hypothetical protein
MEQDGPQSQCSRGQQMPEIQNEADRIPRFGQPMRWRQSQGTTRETVSRLFSRFKKQLLQFKGATLIIRNRSALEKMVNA